MALAWVLKDPRVTTTLIGASSPDQLKENVGALKNLKFTADELSSIDKYAKEGKLNLWEKTQHRPARLTSVGLPPPQPNSQKLP